MSTPNPNVHSPNPNVSFWFGVGCLVRVVCNLRVGNSICICISMDHAFAIGIAREIVAEALTESSVFGSVLRNSYRHNNGFHKLVMRELSDGTKVRMHLYPFPNFPIPKEHVHDHRWGFTSTVLSGKLRMDRFEYAVSGEEGVIDYDAYEYCADKNHHGDHQHPRFGLAKLGKVPLRFVRECVFGPEEESVGYSMEPEELHRINASDTTTLTLMITQPPIGKKCHLFADPGQVHQLPTPETQRIVPYRPQELRDILLQIKALVGE